MRNVHPCRAATLRHTGGPLARSVSGCGLCHYITSGQSHRSTVSKMRVIRDSTPNRYMLLITLKDKVAIFNYLSQLSLVTLFHCSSLPVSSTHPTMDALTTVWRSRYGSLSLCHEWRSSPHPGPRPSAHPLLSSSHLVLSVWKNWYVRLGERGA